MIKRFLSLMLVVPLLFFCKPVEPVDPGTDDPVPDDPQPEVPADDPYAKAAPELISGSTVQVTNENVQKFLAEVNYPDKDLSFTKIFDYYGGFDGKNFDWTKMPNSDKPNSFSIRWKEDSDAGAITLHLADKFGWAADTEIRAGSCFVDITNLLPNDAYTYKVTGENGKVLAEGNFTTTGLLHQVFFKTKCRNARDLGGWKTTDGKMVKYRKVYRGGRMNDPWETMLSKAGKAEVLAEGIGAELELRGSDDYMTEPAVNSLDHCHPCIEEGGKVMLGVTKPSDKNCAKWLVFDAASPWTAEQKAPYLKDGKINKDKIDQDLKDKTLVITSEESKAFMEAYKAKTKECFEFVVNSVEAGKGVYFHCSLGRDRTGTMGVIILGVLGVREGDISKEYELTYFAPVGFSVSSSDKSTNPEPIFKNDRTHWVYSDIVPYFWGLSTDGTFRSGVENYLVNVAGVSQADVEKFRNLMLE